MKYVVFEVETNEFGKGLRMKIVCSKCFAPIDSPQAEKCPKCGRMLGFSTTRPTFIVKDALLSILEHARGVEYRDNRLIMAIRRGALESDIKGF